MRLRTFVSDRAMSAIRLLALFVSVGLGFVPQAARADLAACERYLIAADTAANLRPLDTIQELHVGTYNVENLFMHLGHFEPDAKQGGMRKVLPEKNKPINQIEGVAKAILDMNLDIVVLQEVENIEALRWLNSEYLDDRYVPILIEGNDSRGIDVAFLVKKDLPFDIENFSHKEEYYHDPRLPMGRPTKLFSRDLPSLVVRARGAAPDAKPLFVVLGTHYKSKRPFNDPRALISDPDSNIVRGAQVERTVEIIERYRQEYGADVPLMLAGDFNGAVNTEAEYVALREQAGLEDAFDVAPRKLSELERVTHVYFPGRGEDAERHQIDALFLSEGLKNAVVHAEVYRYKNAEGRPFPLPRNKRIRDKNPSDHFPVKITLKFQPLRDRAK